MKRQILLAICMFSQYLSAAAQELAADPVPAGALRMHWIAHAGGAEGARTLMLILHGVDPATVDEPTLHAIGTLLSSPDGYIVSRAAMAMGRMGARALPYTRRLQQIVGEESCNMTGIGSGDFAGFSLQTIGIPPVRRGCLAWQALTGTPSGDSPVSLHP